LIAERADGDRIQPVDVAPPDHLLTHQPGVLEDLQVLRHRWATDGQALSDVDNGQWLFREVFDDCSSSRVSQDVPDVVP
jgi:hypothetical protein